MSAAGSVVSATDLELFRNLANPAKIDLKQNPQDKNSSRPNIPPTTINGEHEERSRSPSRSSSRRKDRDRDRDRHRKSEERNRSKERNRSREHTDRIPPNRDRENSRTSRDRDGGRRGSRERGRDQSREDRSRDSSIVPPPHSPHNSSRPSSRPSSRHSSRHSSRSQSPTRSPPRTSHNPFRANEFLKPAIRNPGSRPFPLASYPPPPQPVSTPSLFDQETQRYLEPSKLPMSNHTTSLALPNRPRFFTPDPVPTTSRLDSPTLFDESPRPRSRHRSHHHRKSKHRKSSSRSKSRSRSRSSNRHEDEITIQEKRKYLLDLDKLRLQGARLTREYTMKDSLADIRFEFDSHRSNYDVVDTVNFMKEVLAGGFVLIEALNQQFGPILQLRGWAAYMKQNMGRFDRLLERAYHRWWRHGQPSPVMEFGWLVFGSMLMWHVQNRYLGGLPVGDMIGMMGPSGPSNTPAAPSTSNAGNGFSLGGLLRMFTGGGNNQPNAPQPSGASTQQRPPAIIPPALSSAQPAPSNNPISRQPQQQSQQPQQPPRPLTSQVPVQSRPVPPSGTAATLPAMNVRGVTSNVRRNPMRRPSPLLRTETNRPLSPVMENDEHDLPKIN